MLKISLVAGQLHGVEDAYESAVPVILELYPDFMNGVIVSGINRDYYTSDIDGTIDDARKLADALSAKKIPYSVSCYTCASRNSGKLWDALDEWALMLGE
jgi:hypothetical protein